MPCQSPHEAALGAYAEDAFGKKFVKRFNYDLLEGCLQNDVALWDELNILQIGRAHV